MNIDYLDSENMLLNSIANSNTIPTVPKEEDKDVVELSEGMSSNEKENGKRELRKTGGERKRKERELVAECWKDMENLGPNPVTGKREAKCKICKQIFSRGNSASTSSLNRHVKICKKKYGISAQTCLQLNKRRENDATSQAVNFKYDENKMREVIAQYILVHELPFTHVESFLFNELLSTATPHWKKISRWTVRNDIITFYRIEKKKPKELFRGVDRINITTDMWYSDCEGIGYVVVTAHWVDDDVWKLNDRIINFFKVPPPHSGSVICDSLIRCFQEWGIFDKIGTISVDNAKANDVAVRELKKRDA